MFASLEKRSQTSALEKIRFGQLLHSNYLVALTYAN